MHECRVCFWNVARPRGEAQEESRERKYEPQASASRAVSVPECLRSVLGNALLKLNQLLAAFMFIAFLGHHR